MACCFLAGMNLHAQGFYNPLLIPDTLSGSQLTLTLAPDSFAFRPGVNTATMGINGPVLGPTLMLRDGDSVDINVVNQLGEETTIHWHGLHVPSRYDGGPHTMIEPDSTWQVHLRLMNEAATYWYHPHLHMNTEHQAYMGLAGLIIMRDAAEDALDLPRRYGVDDFPLIIQDRTWDALGQFIVEPLSDTMMVNATVHPYLNVPAQVVRFRLLNGSTARNYHIGFSDNRFFQVIAGDASLLDAPVSVNRLLLTNGERVEIALNLTGEQGDTLHLMSYASTMGTDLPGGLSGGGGGSSPLNQIDFPFLELRITAPTANPANAIPFSLVTHTPPPAASADRTRIKNLSGMGSHTMGAFFINGLPFDMAFINDTIQLDDVEIWELINSSNVAHPFHIHDISFFVIEKNGSAPPAHEAALKDVVLMRPNDTIRFITTFSDFTTDGVPYMFHCHNLRHEDDGMMGQFIVVDSTIASVDPAPGALEVQVYPNPVSEAFHFSARELTSDCQLSLWSSEGRASGQWVVKAGSESLIPLTPLADGVYLLRVQSGDQVAVLRLVKN